MLDVKSDFETSNESIAWYKSRLRELIMMTEPQKFCSKDQEPLIWLRDEFEGLIEGLEEEYWINMKLSYLIEA